MGTSLDWRERDSLLKRDMGVKERKIKRGEREISRKGNNR